MRVFLKCFLVFSVLFAIIYFTATSQGGPSLTDGNISITQSFLSMFLAISIFSFWVTMLIDCFGAKDLKNKAVWGISLVFFSWVAAIIYFIAVYRKSIQWNKEHETKEG